MTNSINNSKPSAHSPTLTPCPAVWLQRAWGKCAVVVARASCRAPGFCRGLTEFHEPAATDEP